MLRGSCILPNVIYNMLWVSLTFFYAHSQFMSTYLLTILHSCLKWPLEEIYNLIFEHLTYSAISVPNWNTLQKYFSLAHFLTEMIKTF